MQCSDAARSEDEYDFVNVIISIVATPRLRGVGLKPHEWKSQMHFRTCHLIATALAFAAVGCSHRGEAEDRLKKVGPEQLRSQAAILYKNIFAGAAPTFRTVRSEDWPESFRAMAPLDVGAYRDGFSLAMQRKGDSESGIYVVPQHMEVSPNPGRLAHFDRIAEGIYWYRFEQ